MCLQTSFISRNVVLLERCPGLPLKSPQRNFSSAVVESPSRRTHLVKRHPLTFDTNIQAIMLPPVDSSVTSGNPKFDSLYQDLCTNKLNPDGSSALDAKAQKERDIFATVSNEGYTSNEWACAVQFLKFQGSLWAGYLHIEPDVDTVQDLRTARLEAAKRDLIKLELRNLAYRGDVLPDEVCRSVAIFDRACFQTNMFSCKSSWPSQQLRWMAVCLKATRTLSQTTWMLSSWVQRVAYPCHPCSLLMLCRKIHLESPQRLSTI